MSSPALKLSIAKPCSQDWDAMEPAANSRSCAACQTNVIDFSVMSDETVRNYFINNNYSPVCGRFKNTQLDRIRINIPAYILQKSIPYWKKYLAVLLVCFGTLLFKADVAFGNNTRPFYQTEQKEGKKKHHRKKKKLKLSKFTFTGFKGICTIPATDTLYVTMGFTQTVPDNEHGYLQPEFINTMTVVLDDYTASSASDAPKNNEHDKKTPIRKDPPYNGALIIPVVARLKKWKSDIRIKK